LGELLLGKAIFPGKSTINQVELIIQLMGKPSPNDLESINAATDYSIIESMSAKKKYSFSQFFKGASKEALDFLKRTLVFDPKKRLTAEQALKHPYVKQFHNPEEETVCDKIIRLPISDAKKLSLKEYRDALYNDILLKKKEQRKRWKMKYLQQLGISTTAKPEDIKKLAAKDRRRRDRERRTGNDGSSKTYGAYKKSSGTTGGYKSHVDYNKQASYGASKHYTGSSNHHHGHHGHHGSSKYDQQQGGSSNYQDYTGHSGQYKYYKGSSSGATKKYYKKG
jgi:mitogen-activated protein kinase 15